MQRTAANVKGRNPISSTDGLQIVESLAAKENPWSALKCSKRPDIQGITNSATASIKSGSQTGRTGRVRKQTANGNPTSISGAMIQTDTGFHDTSDQAQNKANTRRASCIVAKKPTEAEKRCKSGERIQSPEDA